MIRWVSLFVIYLAIDSVSFFPERFPIQQSIQILFITGRFCCASLFSVIRGMQSVRFLHRIQNTFFFVTRFVTRYMSMSCGFAVIRMYSDNGNYRHTRMFLYNIVLLYFLLILNFHYMILLFVTRTSVRSELKCFRLRVILVEFIYQYLVFCVFSISIDVISLYIQTSIYVC